VNCRCCNGIAKRRGFYRNKSFTVQRYQCLTCGTSFSEKQPLEHLRVNFKQACQVASLLCEGMGIRAISRFTSLHQQTVLNILEIVGMKCSTLLNRKIRNLTGVEQLETDEVWCFVHCKAINTSPNHPEHGDQYVYLTFDRDSKLIVNRLVGKRTGENCELVMRDLKARIKGRFQLSTDAFRGYATRKGAVYQTFGNNIDFATLSKFYGKDPEGERRYSPPVCLYVNKRVEIGHPDPDMICTSHVERQNLNVRLFNRRFTRLTLGFSKKLINLEHSVAILVAYHNFCRIHSAHGKKRQTPAQAAKLTKRPWTIAELLSFDTESSTLT
jgi:IS1 family transposase/transposase-like protein